MVEARAAGRARDNRSVRIRGAGAAVGAAAYVGDGTGPARSATSCAARFHLP